MSQSNLFVDIGHSAVKWRTLDSEVFSQSVDKFSEKSLDITPFLQKIGLQE